MAKPKPRDLVVPEYNGADISPYDDAPTSPTKSERVNYIADLMSKGRYRSRMTIRALMKVWGLGEDSLEHDASEASRKLATPPEKLEALRTRLASTVEHILTEAMTRPSKVTGLPDYNAALKAAELYGRYSGAEIKVEGNASNGPVEVRIITSAIPKPTKGEDQ